MGGENILNFCTKRGSEHTHTGRVMLYWTFSNGQSTALNSKDEHSAIYEYHQFAINFLLVSFFAFDSHVTNIIMHSVEAFPQAA